MKRTILVIIFIVMTVLLPLLTFAQEATTTNEPTQEETTSAPSFEYFTVKVYTDGQSAWNKRVPVYVQFTATIDSDKFQIDWDSPSGITIIPRYPSFFKVKAGQTYTYKALIEPKIAGTYNIAANVIAWQLNTNYTSSGNTVVTFGENLLTVPVASEYTMGVVIKWVVVILLTGILGYVGYVVSIKSKRKFDKWFNLPD